MKLYDVLPQTLSELQDIFPFSWGCCWKTALSSQPFRGEASHTQCLITTEWAKLAIYLQLSHWQERVPPRNNLFTNGPRAPTGISWGWCWAASQLHFLSAHPCFFCLFQSDRSQAASLINALHATLCLFLGNPTCEKLLINSTKCMIPTTILQSERN